MWLILGHGSAGLMLARCGPARGALCSVQPHCAERVAHRCRCLGGSRGSVWPLAPSLLDAIWDVRGS